jgi:RES domain-containing protein
LIVSAWRIVQERHGEDAFSGEGARLYGGRWNSPGVAVVYTAGSRAMAALEILVHLDSARLLRGFVLCEVKFDDGLVADAEADAIPADWRVDPPPRSTQALGDGWVREARSAVLRVPSVIIAEEHNFLLNPNHPDFGKVRVGKPVAFDFDPRLNRRS